MPAIPRGVVFALGVVAFLACKDDGDEEDDNQFREDVIQCEEAIARLQKCCPDFDGSRVLCNYYYRYDTTTCGPTQVDSVRPALNMSESRCVLDTSCDGLVAGDVCRRAQEARTYVSSSVSSSTSTSGSTAPTLRNDSHPPVCP